MYVPSPVSSVPFLLPPSPPLALSSVPCLVPPSPLSPPYISPPISYHDEGAVEVETLSTALGQHEPAPPLSVLHQGREEEKQIDEGVETQEEELPAVVQPVCSRQVTRSPALPLLLLRGLQPVCSTENRRGWEGRRWRWRMKRTRKRRRWIEEEDRG